MITVPKSIPAFLGIMTQADITQLPLGAAIQCKNLAQLLPGRLRRIPGIDIRGSIAIDALQQIPLLFFALRVPRHNYPAILDDCLFAVYVGTTYTNIVNLTKNNAASGPMLVGTFGQPWSYTHYAQQHLFAGNDGSIKKITDTETYVEYTGTSVPYGNLIKSFRDRLYVADVPAEDGIVYYSDPLTNVFHAANIIDVQEIPGRITALAVNSPSTDNEGIYTQLVVVKRNAIWVWDETMKDIVSQKIGSGSPNTFVNSPLGLLFLGRKQNLASVYLFPNGAVGEPDDVGEALYDILNGSSPLGNDILANAVLDGRFYKLFLSRGADTTNATELWLDVDSLKSGGKPIWYGPHIRGAVDASCMSATRLEMVRRGASGVNTWFAEKLSADSNFTNMDSGTMEAILDLPLNVDPANVEKNFDVLEMQIAKEANVADNAITYEPFGEEISKGSASFTIYKSTISGTVRSMIPLHASDRTGMTARNARLKITHSLNKRLDIIGMTVQYLAPEDNNIRGQI